MNTLDPVVRRSVWIVVLEIHVEVFFVHLLSSILIELRLVVVGVVVSNAYIS